jgi:hypothetical protein
MKNLSFCLLTLLFMFAGIHLTALAQDRPVPGNGGVVSGSSEFDLELDHVFSLINEQQYQRAKKSLRKLEKRYPREAIVHYTQAILHDFMDEEASTVYTMITNGRDDLDRYFLVKMAKAIECDPDFDPEAVKIEINRFLPLSPYFKITSVSGKAAFAQAYLGKYAKARESYRLGREAGGFTDTALRYNVNMLNSCEPNAIIFTNGDMDTFPSWYLQMMPTPRFTENIWPAREIHPTPLSEKAISDALADKGKYLKGIRKDITIANLSLLNISWYIRHLRDREGVLFSWSDDEIDELEPSQMGYEITFSALDPDDTLRFSTYFPESPEFRSDELYYRVSDLAVIDIIRQNFGKRPIYFAITCENYVGFDDYLTNEGLVSRLVSTRDESDYQINPIRLISNIDSVYVYNTPGEEVVLQDRNMGRLIQNYGANYVRAAIWYTKQKDYKAALDYKQKAEQYIDSPIRMTDFYVRYYAGTGEWDRLDEFIRKYIFSHVDGDHVYVSYVLRYFLDNDPDNALDYLRMGMLQYNDQQDLADLAVGYAQEFDRYPQTLAMLESIRHLLQYSLVEYLECLRQELH